MTPIKVSSEKLLGAPLCDNVCFFYKMNTFIVINAISSKSGNLACTPTER